MAKRRTRGPYHQGPQHVPHVGVKQGRFVLPSRLLPAPTSRTWGFWAGNREKKKGGDNA